MSDTPPPSPTSLAAAEAASNHENSATDRRRPWGLAILALVHVLLGGVLLASLGFILFNIDRFDDVLQQPDIELEWLILGLTLVGLANLAIGLGLWTGNRWAWWLATAGYLFVVFRSLAILLAWRWLIDEARLQELARPAPQLVSQMFIATAGQVVVALLLVAYLFRRDVLTYCRLKRLRRRRACSLLALACLVIAWAMTAWELFSR